MKLTKIITSIACVLIITNTQAQLTPNTSGSIVTFKSGLGANINIPDPNNVSTIAKASQAGLIVVTYDANWTYQ